MIAYGTQPGELVLTAAVCGGGFGFASFANLLPHPV